MVSRTLRTAAHRSIRRRLAGVCLLTATALTVALPARAVDPDVAAGAPATVLPAAWGDGDDGWGSPGRGRPPGSTAAVDSEPASSAQSRGVVLIDTVLAGGGGAGTGMVLTSTGEVLTNYHVVAGAEQITVTVATTGASYRATVVGRDETADVALLRLTDAVDLETVEIDDDALAVGDGVTAVGNAGGTGSLTAADGTVTALRATITTAAEGTVEAETLHSLIETDADVVAGDSGGPLLDAEGEVVGIDTAASTGADIDGYAVPIQRAIEVVRQIRSGRETSTVRIGSSGYLGVQLAGYASGALVAGVVDGGAAARAGLQAGDTITGVDGSSITDADQLASLIGGHDAGDSVTVTWDDSSGESHSSTVELGASPTA